jgi:plasmid replication initiation protein
MFNFVKKKLSFALSGRYVCSANGQKLISYMCGLVKPQEPNKMYSFKIKDYAKAINNSNIKDSSQIKETLKEIASEDVWIDIVENDSPDVKILHWIKKIIYSNNEVKFEIDPMLSPYLLPTNSRKDMLVYPIDNISKLTRANSIRLYEFFLGLHTEAYNEDSKKLNNNHFECVKTVLLAKLRLITNSCVNWNYSKFAIFEKEVLSPCINEINLFTNIHVRYVLYSSGKKATRLKLYIKKDVKKNA